MRRDDHFRWRARIAAGLVTLFALVGALTSYADSVGEEPVDPVPVSALNSVEERLQELERRYSWLAEENARLAQQIREQPLIGGEPAPDTAAETPFLAPATFGYEAGYDEGFFISPCDPEQFPFEFKFNNQAQLRYAGFARDVETLTDSAGIVSPVTNRSAFEIPRGRAIFSGYAFAPELTYNLTIDYTTVSSNQVNFWNYWIGYRFNRAATLFFGQTQVPGSREWLTPAIYTLGPDYSLATTFFRPSLSQGIWAIGEPVDGLHYRVMFSNGFNTLGTSARELDSRMTFSGTTWVEPLGDFGRGFSDFECHDDPVLRIGTSFTFAPIEGQQGNPDQPENSQIRLTDGTVLTQPGALAPGVTLNEYNVTLGALDLGWKHRGWSLSGELYIRDLSRLQGNGAIPRTSIVDYGGFGQAAYVVLPQRAEVYARTSQITGPYGYGSEYAGGLNWFWLPGRQNLRSTLDIAWVNHSPADQARSDYRAGDTGLLVRAQMQFFF